MTLGEGKRKRGSTGCIKSIIARKAFVASSLHRASLSYSLFLLLLQRLERAQRECIGAVYERYDSFLLECGVRDSFDNLAFSREIEIPDLLSRCSDDYLHE